MSISPSVFGDLLFFLICACGSDNSSKTNTPLVIDANAVLAFSVSFECL